jgi:hypothetical protein
LPLLLYDHQQYHQYQQHDVSVLCVTDVFISC